MTGPLPPIQPSLGPTTSTLGYPNVNRVDTMPSTENINTTTTTNVGKNGVDENLPQLLDCRGGSHVSNVPKFDKDNFTSWKIMFLVFLDGLEPYLMTTLEEGPYVPMSNLPTPTNLLPKRKNQWSHTKCRPSDIRDTKIAALRLKFNAFKALEGEKVNGTYTRLKCLLNDLKNNGVFISKVEVNATFVNKGKYKGLNAEMAVLTQRINKLSKGKNEKGKGDKGKSEKGLIAESFDWDDESVSSKDEGTTKFKAFMAIAEDKPSVEKGDARSAPMIIFDSEADGDIQEFLLALPKLIRAEPSSSSTNLISLSDLTANMAKLTLNTSSKKNKKSSDKADSSTEQLLLNLMEEVKGIKDHIKILSVTSSSDSQASNSKPSKQKAWFGPCKHCGMKNHLSDDCYSKPKCPISGPRNQLTITHTVKPVVNKALKKLKGQLPLKPTPRKTPRMTKQFDEYIYCGSDKHHPDDYEFYLRCEIYGSIAHVLADCLKNLRNSKKTMDSLKRSIWYLDSGYSRHITGVKHYLHRYSKESGPKAVFGDNSSGDTEGYGSVNCNGITFTRVAYVNGLKHNLISISQLCDANFKVLFTKTQWTILNQNDEVVLIAPRRKDVYVIDMSTYNSENNACFYAKASPSIENLDATKSISQNFSSSCTIEQNGVAEKRNKPLIEAARTMLNSARLPKQFWGESVNAACDTPNRSIIMKRHRKTTYEMLGGIAPDISYFYVFGCPVHIHNHKDHLGKFDEKPDDGFFLGYSPVVKAFRVFNIRRQEMEETFHVTLDEDDEAIS
ncbi:retrovirus-related pol polyprotein from transposon TNT 1-94 [Tanacetum coccineum]